MIEGTHRTVSQVLPQAIQEGLFDELNLFDNSTVRAAWWSPPKATKCRSTINSCGINFSRKESKMPLDADDMIRINKEVLVAWSRPTLPPRQWNFANELKPTSPKIAKTALSNSTCRVSSCLDDQRHGFGACVFDVAARPDAAVAIPA